MSGASAAMTVRAELFEFVEGGLNTRGRAGSPYADLSGVPNVSGTSAISKALHEKTERHSLPRL